MAHDNPRTDRTDKDTPGSIHEVKIATDFCFNAALTGVALRTSASACIQDTLHPRLPAHPSRPLRPSRRRRTAVVPDCRGPGHVDAEGLTEVVAIGYDCLHAVDLEQMCATLKKATGSEHFRHGKLLTRHTLLQGSLRKSFLQLLYTADLDAWVEHFCPSLAEDRRPGFPNRLSEDEYKHIGSVGTILLEEKRHIKKPALFLAATLDHVGRDAPNEETPAKYATYSSSMPDTTLPLADDLNLHLRRPHKMGQHAREILHDARAAPKVTTTSGLGRIAVAFAAPPSTMKTRTLALRRQTGGAQRRIVGPVCDGAQDREKARVGAVVHRDLEVCRSVQFGKGGQVSGGDSMVTEDPFVPRLATIALIDASPAVIGLKAIAITFLQSHTTSTRNSIAIHVFMKQLTRINCDGPVKVMTAIDKLLRATSELLIEIYDWDDSEFPSSRPGLDHLQDLTLCLTNGSPKDLLTLVRTLGHGHIPELRKLTLALPQVALSRAVESLTTLAELARLIGRSRFAGLETITFTLIVDIRKNPNPY
ncbi:uncharacterized protein BXZ73DRAFT_106646 [Epithele typhae]|uniref:uncharacterized protein n=1 Tax=Epithele typhae TaxID=378194 RepID=UPI0020078C2F|nr:uncharacterized protein BXZ73DRAFT_106646 [Epithele typhae]KAH9914401.1 hypothetical protein BXZ73DRAFT_106646 [Epithele typhae]